MSGGSGTETLGFQPAVHCTISSTLDRLQHPESCWGSNAASGTISTEVGPGAAREPGLFRNLNFHIFTISYITCSLLLLSHFLQASLVLNYTRSVTVLLTSLIPLSVGYLVPHGSGGRVDGEGTQQKYKDLNIPFHFGYLRVSRENSHIRV